MPFYEYQCGSCSHHVEALQKISDPPLKKCPECGKQTLKRLISAPVFRLKGGGWYETDFKSDKENKRNLAGREEAGESKTESKAEEGAAKPAAESKAEPAAAKSESESKKSVVAKPTAKPSTKAAAKPAKKPVASKASAKKKARR
jgi:putative FmdB family regulatory protein